MALPFSVKTRLLLAAVLLVGPVAAHAQDPDPHEILRTVRAAQASQNQTMTGRIRTGGKSIPFQLVLAGKTARYEFSDPPQTLILRLQDRDARLEEVTGGSLKAVTPARYDAQVRHTDISYEDLALKFLYWRNARVMGEDTIRTRRCWKVQLAAPSKQSQYSNVMLWIDQQGGALMRMEGYDWNLKLAKRFEVVSAQKIEGRWFLKQMRIEQLAPETGKVTARTYLEIKK